MKKQMLAIITAALCLVSLFPTAAFAQNVGQVQVYDTGSEGLALKASPDVNAARYIYIPENTSISIEIGRASCRELIRCLTAGDIPVITARPAG